MDMMTNTRYSRFGFKRNSNWECLFKIFSKWLKFLRSESTHPRFEAFDIIKAFQIK